MPAPVPMPGQYLSTGTLVGTPLDWFDLPMALTPGRGESDYQRQIAKALAYWNAIPSNSDSLMLLRKSYAITWLTAEQSRRETPPPNLLHVVYPV